MRLFHRTVRSRIHVREIRFRNEEPDRQPAWQDRENAALVWRRIVGVDRNGRRISLKGETAMKKKTRSVLRTITAGVLAVVVAATAITENEQMLHARETFSGLQKMIEQNQQLTVVEIVDDFSESSMGYLMGGLEPYDEEAAKRDGTMDELLDDLHSRGLLTMGNTDDWNSYPLRYEIVDTAYSDYGEDRELLDAGYRRIGEETAAVNGYYEYIDLSENPDIDKAFYRLDASQYSYGGNSGKDIMTMTPAALRGVAEELAESYAPNSQDPDIAEQGYYDTNETGYLYFRFHAGKAPSDEAAQTGFDAVSAGNGAAVLKGLVEATPPVPENADEPSMEETGDPTGPEGEEVPEDTEPGDGETGDVPATGEGSSADTDINNTDINNTDTDSSNVAAGDSAYSDEEGKGTDPASSSGSEDNNASAGEAGKEEPTPVTEPNREDSNAPGNYNPDGASAPDGAALDSARAVIYVEFDENHSVLVASVGNAGVADILEPASDSKQSDSVGEGNPSPSPSPAGIGAGGVSTVTPPAVPTDAAAAPGESTTTPKEPEATTPGGATAAPEEPGTTTPGGGTTAPEEPGTTTPGGGTTAPEEPGTTTPGGGTTTPEEPGTTTPGGDTDTSEEPEPTEPGEDAEGETYTVSYSWDWNDPEGLLSGNTLMEDRDGNHPHTLADPSQHQDEVVSGTEEPYTLWQDYGKGKTLYLFDDNGDLLGIFTFSGWHRDGSDDILNEIEAITEDLELSGEWNFESYHSESEEEWATVSYRWELKEAEEGTLPDGIATMEDIVLMPQIQAFSMDSQPEAECPEEEEAVIGENYIVSDLYAVGDTYEALDKNGNVIGTCTFQGWKISGTGEILPENAEIMLDGDVELVAEWLFYAARAVSIPIYYDWGIELPDGSYDKGVFPSVVQDGNVWKFTGQVILPNGVVLTNGGYFDREPKLPASQEWDLSELKLNADYQQGTQIRVFEGDDLIGTYTFTGWNRVTIGTAGDELDFEPEKLADIIAEMENDGKDTSKITLLGSWEYAATSPAGQIVGSGNAYGYVLDGIHNNNWFRYYVMGLEEKDFGKANLQLVTYLADGSDKRMYGYGPIESGWSMSEALSRADLVYLNTDGVWLDDEGNTVSVNRRFSTENAKKLLERACNADRSARLAVILDGSVRNNQVDENIQKVMTILCQEDIAEAYVSLSEDGMSYEKAFSSSEWQQLNYYASEAIRNSGNFVRDNIYCVSHARGEFRNSTYPEGESVVRTGAMPALANADFENRFTDTVTDAGFAEVYQAIQKENYERAHSGGAYTSLDEYVIPATAVAYILNYRDYDPIIYKDKIRVLELQPCRDYTYYYDGQSGTTEFELKKKFAEDWAQDFVAKLDTDPDAITIDGMTTSEFCGKILDIYEEYDVIYFGANQGIMNRITQPAGFKWVKADSYDGTIGAANPYQPVSWEQNYYTYHDGKWYLANQTGDKKWVRTDSPIWDVGADKSIWVESEGRNWMWKVSEKRWYIMTAQTGWEWVPADHPYTGSITPFWQGTREYSYDGRVQAWRENRAVYTEGEVRPDGPPQGGANWYDNGSAENSAWMWKSSYSEWGEEINLTNDSSQRLYERGWYQKVWIDEVSYTNYALWGNNSDIDTEMNGLLYTHIGGRIGPHHWESGHVGHLAANETALGFRTSGNDILKTQVEELFHYLDGGSLIILAPEFMTQNAAGGQIINSSDVWYTTGSASYRGILDTSSYIYQFVRQAFDRKADGSDVPRYSNLIVEDYGNGALKDTEAFVQALNQQKVTLNLYSAPEAYRYDTVDAEYGRIDGDSRAMLKKAEDGKYYLSYEFMIGNLSAVAPLTTRYHVQLFLDSNSDGIYNTASEELSDITVINAQTGEIMERQGGKYQLQMGVPYRVVRELPDGYVGCIGWKLMVSQNGNSHIHDSVTGLTAVPVQPGYSDEVNPETGKKIIHVLQITPDLWASAMDLEKQTEEDGDAQIWVDGEMQKKNPGQYGTSDASRDWEWYRLLNELPDFEIDFDSIYYWDFAHSFLKPGQSGYDPQFDNGGVDGKLTGPNGRKDYLNLYQYDMVIVGFHDSIPSIPSQAAIDALLRYADMGKSMLFTHDTTYNSGFSTVDDFSCSTGNSQPLSMSIRELCAMDRFGVSVDWYAEDENGVKHSNVAVSPIRNTGGVAAVAYNASSGAYQWNASHPGGTTRDVAFAPGTNQTMMAAHTQGTTWVYTGTNSAMVMFDWASHGFDPLRCGHNMNRDTANPDKTCEVSRVNSGIITQYPYDIPEEIRVGSTHGQYYQLDLDTDWDGDGRGDVVCWYAIKSLDNGDWNDIYDFSPNDVRNNYYIYNKGNITYSGVGHDVDHITLDEKKLFINTFVAAYNAGIRNPSVRIVEDGSVNAPDLESVSIPFNGVDEATAGTYRVYYQVKDNNITQGTRNLSIKYYIGNAAGSETVTYRTESGTVTIQADLLPNNVTEGDGGLITYSADTGLPVRYDEVRSGFSYYVDVPLTKLLDRETFDFYVEVDLTMVDDPGRVAAFDVDKLTIAKLKMFSLD